MKNISDCESINRVNPLYFTVGKTDGHIEEKNGNKYLVFDYTDNNKKVLKKHTEFWDGIKNLIKTIDNRLNECENDFIKIKFNSDDNLSLNQLLKFHVSRIIVRSVFKEDGKYYPQFFLDECLY